MSRMVKHLTARMYKLPTVILLQMLYVRNTNMRNFSNTGKLSKELRYSTAYTTESQAFKITTHHKDF